MDRPKRKHEIPGCSPWLLVETKLGRRFVFNPENNESYWKFPLEVMKGVIEFDRLQREKKQQLQDARSQQDEEKHAHEKENEKAVAAADRATPDALAVPAPTVQDRVVADDDDEYEEVEVTDNEDEEEENAVKRQRIEDTNDQPVEFNEDDMAYQLAAMGEEYGLDPGEYGEGGEDLEEGAEGLELTEQDSSALFKDMLNDYNISPYSTWEKIVEAGQIVQDDRYTALPNMKSRKELWGQWSRERIQQLKEQREKEEKKDPRIPFFAFLQKYATPKLYWPEFRRKYKKEAEMRDSKISDKDREKWYREHINRKFYSPLQIQRLIIVFRSKIARKHPQVRSCGAPQICASASPQSILITGRPSAVHCDRHTVYFIEAYYSRSDYRISHRCFIPSSNWC